jgi:hypothetical protein
VSAKGRDLSFNCQKLRRSSGFKSREETLRKISKFRRVEVLKGGAQKIEVRRKDKYGGLSGRNPSEKNLKIGQDRGSRSIQKEPKYFKPLDLGEVAHWLVARSYRNFTKTKDLEEVG